jgi:F-type H+-transporting ATPase subunit b
VVSIDYSLAIQIVNFILLILILNRLLYKPILGMMDKRKRQFEESDAEVKRLRETVDQKMAAYEERLRQAKVEAVEAKNEVIRQGAEEAKAVIDAARAEIPGMMEQFQARIDREVGEATRILQNQSQKLSVEIAEKVLGRSLR